MTLHERIQLLMLGFLVVLGLTAAVGVVAVGQRDQLVAEAETFDAGGDAANALLASYLQQRSQAATTVQREQARETADTLVAGLRARLQDKAVAPAVDRVDKARADWHAAVSAAGDEEQRTFPELQTAITSLRADLQQREKAAAAQLGRARRQINLALLVAFLDGVALLVAVSVALRRWSTKPLAEITSAMRDVTGGALDRRIPAAGPADVAELGRDADLMRRRIVAELDGARRAEQALRSQGAIVSVLRKELGPSSQALPDALSMAAGFEPVKGVLAGDWYDVLPLSDGTVAMCLIDVSGHGQATGVFALQAKNLLVAGARQLLAPGEVLSFLASALGDTGDNFLTCFVARIDPDTGRCEYANAGHLPALLTRGSAVEELGPTGPLLGPLPGSWSTVDVALAAGSVIVAYTDGVTEARGRGGEEFGEERLRAVVAARAHEHPTTVVTTCLDAVHDFSRGEPDDDLTIVAVRWSPPR